MIVLLLLIQHAYQQCYKQTDMQYVVTAGEQQIINLNEIFTDSYDSTYTIDNTDAVVKPRINLIRQIDHASNPIIKLSAKLQDGSEYWTNKFWYLDQGQEQQIWRASGPQGDVDRLPNYNFNKKIVSDKFQYCYDFDIYQSYFPNSKDILIIDCAGFASAGQPINNFFVLYDESKDTITTYDSKNMGNFDKVYTREVIFNSQQQHIYRSYPIRGLEGEELSIIEVYQYQDFSQIGLVDTNSINERLRIQDYQFKLVKMIYNGALNVLDVGGNLLQYQPDLKEIIFMYKYFKVPQFGLTFDVINSYQYIILTQNKLYYLEPYFSVEVSVDVSVDSSKNYDAKFTRHYIVVQLDTKIRVYSSQELKLIATYDIPKLQRIQVDQTTDEFLAYTSEKIQRFIINSQSSLYLGNPKGKTASNPIQITQNKGVNVCTSKATLSQLPLGDGKIFVKSQLPLINSNVASENSLLQYNDVYDGPVISYQQSSPSDKVALRFEDLIEVQNMENYTDVVFVKMISHFSYPEESFYLIQQYNNSERQVAIFDCYEIGDYDFKRMCKSIVDIVNFPLFDEYTQIWVDGQNIRFALRSLPTTLSIYKYNLQKNSINTELIDFDPVADNVITQIVFSTFYLYVLKAKPKILTVYTTNEVTQILSYVKEDYMSTLGLQWTPTKIFSSTENSYVFAVLNGDYLDIFQNFHYQYLRPTCLKSIQIPNGATIDVQIFEFEIAITYITKEGNFEIDILNYRSFSDIFTSKKAPSFNYIIEQPIILQSYKKNYLFIYVKEPKTLKKYFFQYKLQSDTHSLLHKGLSIQNLQSGLSVASYNDLLFYVGENGKQNLVFIPQRTQITAQVSINDNIYFEKIKVSIDVKNPIEKLTVTQDLEVLNQQLNIQLLSNKVKWGLNSLQASEQNKCYQLGNEWYSGQVSQFKALCDQCSDSNPLAISSPIFIGDPARRYNYQTIKEPLYDIQTFDQNNVVLLFERAFSIHSITTNVRYKFEVLESSFRLRSVAVYNKDIYLVQLQGQQIIIYSCESPSKCTYQKMIKGLINTQKSQITGDFLILSSFNSVKAISLKDNTKDIPEKTIVIQDIKAIQITGNYYQFWVLEYDQLKIVDAQLNTDSLVLLKTQSYDILEQLIDLKQLYRTETETFITGLGISNYAFNTNKLTVDLLLVTSNVANYGFEFTLDHNAGSSLVTSIDVAYILNSPPNSAGTNFVQITDKNIVLASYVIQDGYSAGQFVSFYDLPKTKSTKPQTYVGSFILPMYYDEVVSAYNNGTYVFYDAANYFIFNLQLDKGPQLCLFGEIQSQKIQLVAENFVESKSIQLNIGFAGKSASSLWWVWVLVTLALLILIFIAIFIVIKRKNKKRRTLLINE